MLNTVSKLGRSLLRVQKYQVADYNQVYDGIINFEDKQGLG